jgi:acyl-CoA thioester hydrolase
MPDTIPGPLFTELTFTVKTYDIDFAGHVSNIVYIRWLEDLRFALLDEYFPLEPSMKEGVYASLETGKPVRVPAELATIYRAQTMML